MHPDFLPFRQTCLAALMAGTMLVTACGGGNDGTSSDPAAAEVAQVASHETAQAVAADTWTQVAAYYEEFTTTTATTVRYGTGTQWISRTVLGKGVCSSTFFGGDPALGAVKRCEALAAAAPAPAPAVVDVTGVTLQTANRFLTQATLGPSDADVARVMAVGYAAWIDEQAAKTPKSVRSYVESIMSKRKLTNPSFTPGQAEVINGVWSVMLTDSAQLRQRIAYSLSQIFVVSLVDGTVHHEPRAAAAYYDMLAQQGLGNYRTLLESVARHPVMSKYLSSLGNRKADALTGRVPDENFAREIMQLFSIGLYELNQDGTLKLDGAGRPIETYSPDDVAGMAKVFTGWSWDCPTFPSDSCFVSTSSAYMGDYNLGFKPIAGYPQWHATDAKTFLGTTVAAQSTSNPNASLKVALDRLFNHPNVGPFVGKQLIQRLVTSNPSPAYVSAVAAAFNNNGTGVRGDMKAVVKAVLTHPEARSMSSTAGKVREPVLRVSAIVRAFPATSNSGEWVMGATDDLVFSWGQTPLRSPTVFNYFRPGYVPAGSLAAGRSMVTPEMQIVNETTVASWVNQIRYAIQFNGFGVTASNGLRDIQLDFSKEVALATNPAALVDRISNRLMYGSMPAPLRTEIVNAISSLPIPALLANQSNLAAVESAKRTRVNAALLLATASPEFIVQK